MSMEIPEIGDDEVLVMQQDMQDGRTVIMGVFGSRESYIEFKENEMLTTSKPHVRWSRQTIK